MSLKTDMQALAMAVGDTVIIGCYSHREDWFATCAGEEWQGPTPEAALASVRSKLLEKTEAEAACHSSVASKLERLRAL